MAGEEILTQICGETGASREEALYYLEGFEWNLVDATKACREKLLPPVKVKSSPGVPVNEKSASEESLAMMHSRLISIQSPSTPARMMDSRRSSNQVPINSHGVSNQSQWEEPSLEMQKELINRLREVALELSPQEAIDTLRRFHWNVEHAAHDFMEKKFPQHDSFSDEVNLPMSGRSSMHRRRNPTIGVSIFEDFSSQDDTSAELAKEVMNHRGPPLPLQSQLDDSMRYPKQGQIGSSSSCSMNVESDEKYTPVPITYSSQAQSMESSNPPPPYKVDRICNETKVGQDEAFYYLDAFDGDLALALEACRSKTLPPAKVKTSSGVSRNERSVAPPSRQVMRIQPEQQPPKQVELPTEVEKERIHTVCEATQMTPEVAVSYLKRYNWNANSAINGIIDDSSGDLDSQLILEEDHSTMGQSNLQWASGGDRATTEFSEDATSKALASMRLQNISLPVPSMGSPSQSQFQASRSSFSSMMNVDPTEIEESLKDASDESVPVAIPPMASSQVNNKLKGKAVEDTETVPDHTLNIVLAEDGSGDTLKISFRSDQTIRDIHNAIDERTPDNDRKYYLQAMVDDVNCRDLNVTVGTIIKRGSTTLLQVLLDP